MDETKNVLVFVFVSAGYSCLSEPSVLHDSCHSRMFICLHAASVHATKLHRLCIRTSHGQRHGKTVVAPLVVMQYWNRGSLTNFVSSQVKTGFVMNILGILSVTLAMNTWGVAMFDLNTFPEWAHPFNKSVVVADGRFSSVRSLNATLWSPT